VVPEKSTKAEGVKLGTAPTSAASVIPPNQSDLPASHRTCPSPGRTGGESNVAMDMATSTGEYRKRWRRLRGACPGQGAHRGGLGGAVGGRVRHGDEPGGRGNVEHVAGALAPEDGGEGVAAVDDAPEVHVDHTGPFLEGHLAHGAHDADARVVDQQVHAAQVL